MRGAALAADAGTFRTRQELTSHANVCWLPDVRLISRERKARTRER